MTALEAVLMFFDNAWSHDWESLIGVLADVGDEEASWQAPCYRDVTSEPDSPPPGTIRWHVTHLAYCKRGYTARLHGDRAARTPDVAEKPTANLTEDLAELHAAHAAKREAVAALTPEELTPVVVDFLTNTTRHDTWHAGQIALVRRMWRHRSG